MAKKNKYSSEFQIMCDVEAAVAGLDDIPNTIEFLIESLHLDRQELTKDEILNIGLNAKMIYSTLSIIQHRIWNIGEKLALIQSYATKGEEDSDQ
ncbi:MAG: hypothetical protein K6E33_09910 [Lachnospiraceae bacterium]|nr:hypothetical protein [Lachnospiraceae bacterium]